jgi:hypothetical protein
MIIFGLKKRQLLSQQLPHLPCQACGKHGMGAEVFVKYFHIFMTILIKRLKLSGQKSRTLRAISRRGSKLPVKIWTRSRYIRSYDPIRRTLTFDINFSFRNLCCSFR